MQCFAKLFLTFLVLAIAACAQLTAQVSSTGTLPAKAAGATVGVVAADRSLSKSLFFARTRAVIEAEFRSRGYRVVPAKDGPLYLALARYKADAGRSDLVTTERRLPRYIFKRGVGNVFLGYETVIDVREVESFGREVSLIVQRMDDPGGPVRVYEGTAVSRGPCGNINEVADHMYLALFQKFPAGSGRVTVEAEIKC
jgi:hypothetical protein